MAHAHAGELERGGLLARSLLDTGELSDDPDVRDYGFQAWGVHQWALGNIGVALEYLSRMTPALPHPSAGPQEGLHQHQQLLAPVMFAQMTALHGDVDGARFLLDNGETRAGDDPYGSCSVGACSRPRAGPSSFSPSGQVTD